MCEENRVIDMTVTDRDIIMGDMNAKTEISNEIKPELVIAGRNIDDVDSLRSMDGDTFKVVHDEKMRCFNLMFEEEQTGSVTCDVDNGPSQMKRMSQE